MGPGANIRQRTGDPRRGTGIAAIIAVLFAVLATVSFAVDQTITPDTLDLLPPPSAGDR